MLLTAFFLSVAAVIGFLIWLFSPGDPVWARRTCHVGFGIGLTLFGIISVQNGYSIWLTVLQFFGGAVNLYAFIVNLVEDNV